MKIGGKSLTSRNTDVVHIVREENGEKHVFELTVCAVPAGWGRKMSLLGLSDYPPAPKRIVRLAGGQVMKDSKGKPEMESDYNDPTFSEAVSKATERLEALKLAEVLKCDPTVEWESKEPENNDKKAWAKHADALADEIFRESSLTGGEIEHILETAHKLDNSLTVEEATSDFLDLP